MTVTRTPAGSPTPGRFLVSGDDLLLWGFQDGRLDEGLRFGVTVVSQEPATRTLRITPAIRGQSGRVARGATIHSTGGWKQDGSGFARGTVTYR